MNNEFRNYYDELGLPKDGKYEEGIFKGSYISREGIEKAMDRIKMQFGRDSNEFRRAEEAYNILSDYQKRIEYNIQLEEYMKNANLAVRQPKLYEQEKQNNDIQNNDIEKIQRGIEAEVDKIKEETIKEEYSTEKEPEKEKQVPEQQDEEAKQTAETEEKEKNAETEEKESEKEKTTKTSDTQTDTIPIHIDNESKDKKKLQIDNVFLKNIVSKGGKILGRLACVAGGVALGYLIAPPAGAIAIGIVSGIVSPKLIKKLKKSKLVKDSRKKKIKGIQTEETKILESYREKLEKEIYQLLSKPLDNQYSNYKLEMACLKYKNQIELLQQRLEVKQSQTVKKGSHFKHKLECVALVEQLNRAKQNLTKINNLIYEAKEKADKKTVLHGLEKANDKLYRKQQEIDNIQEKQSTTKKFLMKKLKVKKSMLLKTRDRKAKRLKLTTEVVGSVKDGFVNAFDVTKSVAKNIFTKYEDIDLSSSAKTR